MPSLPSADVFMDRATAVWAAPALADTASAVDGLHLLELYVADGLLEALEWANDGVGTDEAACMWLAALRWVHRATGAFPAGAPEPLGRWIDTATAALPLAPAPAGIVNALSQADMGTTGRPNPLGLESAAVLLPATTAGLLAHTPPPTSRHLGADATALMGSGEMLASAGATADAVRRLVTAPDVAAELDALRAEYRSLPGVGAALEALGEVTSPEEAAIALAATDLKHDGGAHRLALALAGAAYGTRVLPDAWDQRPAAGVVLETARRWRELVFPS